MSDQPQETPGTTDSAGTGDSPGTTDGTTDSSGAEAPLDDVPPVAGGTDDSPPAQGEGESDSW